MRIRRIVARNAGCFDTMEWIFSESKNSPSRVLIFGWNGTGKTTISSLLSAFDDIFHSNESPRPALDNASFSFKIDLDNDSRSISSFRDSRLKTFVFNSLFVHTSTFLKGSIIYLGPNITEDIPRLEYIKKQISDLQDEIKAKNNAIDDLRRKRERIFDKIYRAVRDKFGDEFHQPSYFSKRKIEQIWGKEFPKDATVPVPTIEDETLRLSSVVDLSKKTRNILEILSNCIKDLANLIPWPEMSYSPFVDSSISLETRDPRVHSWLEEGQELHVKYECSSCIFCESSLHPDWKSRIEARLKKDLDLEGKAREILDRTERTIDKAQEIFPKLLLEELDVIRKMVHNIKDAIDTSNPTKVKQSVLDIQEIFKTIESNLENFLSNQEKTVRSARLEQANNLICFLLYHEQEALLDIENEVKKIKIELNGTKNLIHKLSEEKSHLEDKSSRLPQISDGIERRLRSVFSNQGMSVKWVTQEKAFKIDRRGRNVKHLSDGERNAFALAYWLEVIYNLPQQYAPRIAVIDDPFTSMDYSHGYDLMNMLRYFILNSDKISCAIEQIIVLTHNDVLLRWIGDLFKEGGNGFYRQFYICRTSEDKNAQQRSWLAALPHWIKEGDEYIFLFGYAWRLSKNEKNFSCYPILNNIRRLLEMFFGFYFPNITGPGKWDNYFKHVEQRIDKSKLDKEELQLLKSILHEGSHSSLAEVGGLPSARIALADKVAKAALKVIQLLAPEHYKGMCQRVASGSKRIK